MPCPCATRAACAAEDVALVEIRVVPAGAVVPDHEQVVPGGIAVVAQVTKSSSTAGSPMFVSPSCATASVAERRLRAQVVARRLRPAARAVVLRDDVDAVGRADLLHLLQVDGAGAARGCCRRRGRPSASSRASPALPGLRLRRPGRCRRLARCRRRLHQGPPSADPRCRRVSKRPGSVSGHPLRPGASGNTLASTRKSQRTQRLANVAFALSAVFALKGRCPRFHFKRPRLPPPPIHLRYGPSVVVYRHRRPDAGRICVPRQTSPRAARADYGRALRTPGALALPRLTRSEASDGVVRR